MFLEYLKFFLATAFLFFLPGFSILYLFLRPKIKISQLEFFVFSVGMSFTAINFCVLFMNKAGIALTSSNLTNAFLLMIALPLVLSTFPSWKTYGVKNKSGKNKSKSIKDKPLARLPDYLKINQKALITAAILIAISFFISSRYLAKDIVPNNTDLGHHMYWVKVINETKTIPDYGTSDVIVGEHIPFAVLFEITNLPILSAYPVILLFFVNSITFLTVYALALRLFKNQAIALIAFSLIGVLYVIPAPMTKFVSGGVVGNVFGNLYIPLIILATLIAFRNNTSQPLTLAVILSAGLSYIHHLSALLLIFILVTAVICQLILNGKKFNKIFTQWLKLLFSPLSILAIVSFILFVSLAYTPHYVKDSAVKTVIGSPIKDTHQGVSSQSLISSVGEWRLALGLMGFIIFIIKKIRERGERNKRNEQNGGIKSLNFSIVLGWILILMVLSLYPQIFKIDLPSRRVVNYLITPLSLTAAYCIYIIFSYLKPRLSKQTFYLTLITFIIAISLNGYVQSLQEFKTIDQFEETVQLYHAAEFLSENSTSDDVILKDHANLPADTFLKFFFMRGYDYILARTFDYKYEDPTKEREQCTLYMATSPDSPPGQTCFNETNTNYVILKKNIDNLFFDLSDNFAKIYENNIIVIYKKKNS